MIKIKYKLLVFLLFVFAYTPVSAQLHHQMLSSQGSTSETNSGIVVTQTIGQTSVIGAYTNRQKKIIQGYQQPFLGRLEFSINPDFEAFIFPNPFDEIINIKYNSESDIEVSLFDVAQKSIYKSTLHASDVQHTINLEMLSSGVYFIKLQSKKGNYFTKLMKR